MTNERGTGPGNGGKLVTVGRFLNPLQAQMAKGMLESSGIPCFLQGENANNMVPLAFRVRLQVLEEDEAIAQEYLRSVGDAPEAEQKEEIDEP